ncbi:MAG: hypothetical protein DRP08_02480, partial [Candidatus Aenigmatarchaeota archaeon]
HNPLKFDCQPILKQGFPHFLRKRAIESHFQLRFFYPNISLTGKRCLFQRVDSLLVVQTSYACVHMIVVLPVVVCSLLLAGMLDGLR